MSSPRTGLYRSPAEQPTANRPNSAFPRLSTVPLPTTAAARKVAEVFSLAGIQIGGRRPWDLQVRDERFYARLLAGGDLAAGESYMDGWWDAEALDELCTRVHGANLPAVVGGWEMFWLALKGRILNRQRRSRAAEVAERHYNLGNDVYQAMLDLRMQYTCGYWKDAATLDQAQEHKLRLICRKLQLRPGGRLCGTVPFHGIGVRLPRGDVQHFGGASGLRPRMVQRPAGAHRAEGLPRGGGRNRDLRPCGVGGTVRAHRREKLPRVPGIGARVVESRRTVPAAHHRRQPILHLHRCVDRQIHLPQRDDALRGPTGQGHGRALGGGRLAQFRSGL